MRCEVRTLYSVQRTEDQYGDLGQTRLNLGRRIVAISFDGHQGNRKYWNSEFYIVQGLYPDLASICLLVHKQASWLGLPYEVPPFPARPPSPPAWNMQTRSRVKNTSYF